MIENPLFIKDQATSSYLYIVQMIEHPLFIKDQATSSDLLKKLVILLNSWCGNIDT